MPHATEDGRDSRVRQPFVDPAWTARGEKRATVALARLETLWFNTGTLCNIDCAHCYIESSPKNDRLAYLTLSDVLPFLDEIEDFAQAVSLIGFTGGEPFMNPAFVAILEETLRRGFETLTLTNALKPMERWKPDIVRLAGAYGSRVRIRVSLDDFRPETHDAERGEGAFAQAVDGLLWLLRAGVHVEVAARLFAGDSEGFLRRGFAGLFQACGAGVDCDDAQALVLLPEMREGAAPPEITEACWGILGLSPNDVMCSNARMVVKRKGAAAPAVAACTLLPYDARFELGATLAEASKPVPLLHPYCATFCVLGGGSCGSARHAA
jgi:uncharacterized Fe-S cluster-containing radical SAM superfamily protein